MVTTRKLHDTAASHSGSELVPHWKELALLLSSVVVGLLLCEILLRAILPSGSLWHYPNYIAQTTRPDPDEARWAMLYDRDLGYAPRPGSSVVVQGHTVTYTAEALRSNGRPAPQHGSPILVVGDSYTEGYGVDDDQTWPSLAEQYLARRFLNGGVRAYGIDQMILRAERLADRLHPRAIILAFIEADIDRTAMSIMASVQKPYFVPAGDGLELRNVPPPPPARSLWRDILGHSFLLDAVMRHAGARDWWYGDKKDTGENADLITCRLMHRFAGVVRQKALFGAVVALPQVDLWAPGGKEIGRSRVKAVLDCARKEGLFTVDTYDAFAAAGVAQDSKAFYTIWHPNGRANSLAAKAIGDALAPVLPP